MNQSEGEAAVHLARAAALAESKGEEFFLPEGLPESFAPESGAFVTVLEYPGAELRACIGYPEPVFPLGRAIAMAAVGAVHDPRFPTLTPAEAEACLFEVTILTPPQPLPYSDPEDLKSRIVIGRDGLIIECHGRRGLFLPQVPVEQGWDTEQYLNHLCLKAGLRAPVWKSGDASFKVFRGEIFEETEPKGPVVKRE